MPRPYFSDHQKKIEEIIRVDHAGETGAQVIYEGQLAYTKSPEDKELIRHMLEQEKEHLEYFEDKIKNGAARPTVLMPLWNKLGYALGALSAKMDAETAMLVTESVEEVIVEHYQDQIDYLEKSGKNKELLAKIKQFQADEAEHIHIAVDNNSGNASFNRAISGAVKAFCRGAIFLSKKL